MLEGKNYCIQVNWKYSVWTSLICVLNMFHSHFLKSLKLLVKVKGNVVPVHNKALCHEYVWGSSSIAPCMHAWMVSHPVDRVLVRPLSQYEHSDKEKKSLPCPHGELNPGCPAYNLITILIEIPWLTYFA